MHTYISPHMHIYTQMLARAHTLTHKLTNMYTYTSALHVQTLMLNTLTLIHIHPLAFSHILLGGWKR